MKSAIVMKTMAKLVSTALATVSVAGGAVALNPNVDFKDILPAKDTEIVAEAAETEAPVEGQVTKSTVDTVAAAVEEASVVNEFADEIAEAEGEVESEDYVAPAGQSMSSGHSGWGPATADEMDLLKIQKQQEQAERDRIIAEKKAAKEAAKKAAEEAAKSEEQKAAEKAAAEKAAAEKAEAERIAAEKAAAEAAAKAEADRIAAEKAAAEKAAAEEAARIAAEKAAAEEAARIQAETAARMEETEKNAEANGNVQQGNSGYVDLSDWNAEWYAQHPFEQAATYYCSCGFSTKDEGALDDHMMNHMLNGEQCSYSTSY